MWPDGSGMARVTIHVGQPEQQRAVPVLLDWRLMLIDTDEVVCFLNGLRVYPSSLRCRATWLMRPGAGRAVKRAFAGGRPTGPHDAVTAAEIRRGPLLGVRYEDGRAAALDFFCCYQVTHPEGAELPVFELGAGSRAGDGGSAELSLYGLPEQGSIALFWSWLAVGVPESSLELDGDALREAASRAVVLWDASADGDG
jgi:hypothetical protein